VDERRGLAGWLAYGLEGRVKTVPRIGFDDNLRAEQRLNAPPAGKFLVEAGLVLVEIIPSGKNFGAYFLVMQSRSTARISPRVPGRRADRGRVWIELM